MEKNVPKKKMANERIRIDPGTTIMVFDTSYQ
jgi:hypothetical protein